MIDPEKKRAQRRAFYWRHRDRILSENREKYRANKEHRDYIRHRNLVYNFGISKAEYDSMHQSQDGRCFICKVGPPYPGKPSLAVDHDHETGKIRRLLCGHCNGGLGFFKDSPALLRAAADYVEAHKK